MGILMEIGATWITQKDHWIFNMDGFKPQHPLDIEKKIVEIVTHKGPDGAEYLSIAPSSCNSFALKIMMTCETCGYEPKPFDDNKKYLLTMVSLFEP